MGSEHLYVVGVPDDVLIDADTIRSPELRHEIPAGVMDPFLYGERDGVPFAAVSPLDAATIAAARPDLQQLDTFDLGLRDLIDSGLTRDEALLEIRLRACREMGVTRAAVPPTFPLATAEHLRAGGVEVSWTASGSPLGGGTRPRRSCAASGAPPRPPRRA